MFTIWFELSGEIHCQIPHNRNYRQKMHIILVIFLRSSLGGTFSTVIVGQLEHIEDSRECVIG